MSSEVVCVCVLPGGRCVERPPLPLPVNSAGQSWGRGSPAECIYKPPKKTTLVTTATPTFTLLKTHHWINVVHCETHTHTHTQTDTEVCQHSLAPCVSLVVYCTQSQVNVCVCVFPVWMCVCVCSFFSGSTWFVSKVLECVCGVFF